MSIREMWRTNAVMLVVMIVLSLGLFSLGTTPWAVLGTILLLVCMFFNYRQGMAGGHEACAILNTVREVGEGELDKKVLAKAYSEQKGLKGMLLSALIPYVASCAYIICMLASVEPLVLPTRLIAWVLALPFWPLIVYWCGAFDALQAPMVVVYMLSPFVLPACFYAGYLRGPALWKKSEEAMAQGRRRAKAKSRIIKKRTPKAPKPEI